MATDLALLGSLLDRAGLTPLIKPERMTTSALYDFQYRVSICALAFHQSARSSPLVGPRVRAARLKLYQFVAVRPWLLPSLRAWATRKADPQPDMLDSQNLRRGFVSDTMHDDVVAYLIARRILLTAGDFIALDRNGSMIASIREQILSNDLFAAERLVIEQAQSLRVTNEMLEGW